MKKVLRSQSGFSLVTTLFIVVVLSLVGSYMSLIASSQQHETSLSIQGLRAGYAVSSGLEWVNYEVNETNLCPSVPTVLSIEGFTVTLSQCTPTSITESGNNYIVHDVIINAERGSFGEVDYVSRTIRATLGGL